MLQQSATVGLAFQPHGSVPVELRRGLQGRHKCFQIRYRVNELLVLLMCQTHSSHGYHHNSSSRTVRFAPLPLWNDRLFYLEPMKRSQNSTTDSQALGQQTVGHYT